MQEPQSSFQPALERVLLAHVIWLDGLVLLDSLWSLDSVSTWFRGYKRQGFRVSRLFTTSAL